VGRTTRGTAAAEANNSYTINNATAMAGGSCRCRAGRRGYHNMLVEIFIGTYLTIDDVNRFSLR
jgi:hypothetical protein